MAEAAPLEERVAVLEEKYGAHDRLIGALHDEMAVQSSRIRKVMTEGQDVLRQSHHEIEVGMGVRIDDQVRRLGDALSKQIVDQSSSRKENRLLFLALAAMLFVGWVLHMVKADATTVVGLVSALLAAFALFWQQLAKSERRAKDSISPPPPKP